MHKTCMKMRMTNLLYVRQQERNRSKKNVFKPLMTKILRLWFLQNFRDLLRRHSDRRTVDPPEWKGPTALLELEVTRDSRERADETEGLRNIINKLSDELNLNPQELILDYSYSRGVRRNYFPITVTAAVAAHKDRK